MTVLSQTLEYYLDSEMHFKQFVSYFFKQYEHEGECGSELLFAQFVQMLPYTEKRYHFESTIYQRFCVKIQSECGYRLEIPDACIQKYFTANYSKTQLFAIIFALWHGISAKQIASIANKRNEKYACALLNFFICNPQEEQPPQLSKELFHYRYAGSYTVFGETPISAKFQNGGLLTDNGQVFKIL